jgi:nicotinamidase-related amidase
MNTALLLIDIQKDYFPGGKMAIAACTVFTYMVTSPYADN